MHIIDEAKKNLKVECPRCERVIEAYQLTLKDNREATLFYKCGCGLKYRKKVKLELAVDLIE